MFIVNDSNTNNADSGGNKYEYITDYTCECITPVLHLLIKRSLSWFFLVNNSNTNKDDKLFSLYGTKFAVNLLFSDSC